MVNGKTLQAAISRASFDLTIYHSPFTIHQITNNLSFRCRSLFGKKIACLMYGLVCVGKEQDDGADNE